MTPLAATRRAILVLAALAPAIAMGQAPSLPSVSVREASERLSAGKSVLVDIRTPEEWQETGVPKGALKLDMTAPDFVMRLDQLRKANPGKDVDLICRTANRSAFVQARLQAAGWKELVNVRGGLAGRAPDGGWIAAGLPLAK